MEHSLVLQMLPFVLIEKFIMTVVIIKVYEEYMKYMKRA